MGMFDKLRGLFGRNKSKSGHGKHDRFTILSGSPGADPASSAFMPPVELALELPRGEVAASHSGPEGGIDVLRACVPSLKLQWDLPADWAYGSSISMYDASPATGRRSGEPIADCYVVVGYGSGAFLAVADGVNWGEPARRAARCAVLGATAHMHAALERFAQPGGVHNSSSDAPSSQETAAAGTGKQESAHLRLTSAAPSSTAPSSTQPAPVATSHELFQELFGAVQAAQKLIKQQCGTMTTLVLALVLPAAKIPDSLLDGSPLQEQDEGVVTCSSLLKARRSISRGKGDGLAGSSDGPWAALTLTVGDSPAYVWRAADGRVQEMTAASHAGAVRDPRWTPGALGYALGDDPDLANMTASITLLYEGDIVFLTSDGVADNFDPVIMKTARRAPYASEVAAAADAAAEPGAPPLMTQDELEAAALVGMRRAIADAAGISPETPRGNKSGNGGASQRASLNARQLADGLLRHVYSATEQTRQFTEQRAVQAAAAAEAAKQKKTAERSLGTDGARRASISSVAMSLPGKMDHATVAAYQVGRRVAAT